MPDEKKYSPALEAHLKQWQEIAERVHRQMEPFRDIHESIRKSMQPIVEAQETLLIDFQKAIQASISPAFLELHKAFRELPARTQEALLLLGQHGWYMDPEMAFPELWELKNALADGNAFKAEAALIEYFEGRLTEIEESITTKFPHRCHLIHPAFGAHRREEYALSIPVLLAQADGICKETVDQHLFLKQDKKPRTAIYVAQIAADTYMTALLSPLAETLPIGASEKERPEGFSALNRHTVLHGEALDYGSKANSLKAISLVNYVAHVLPASNP